VGRFLYCNSPFDDQNNITSTRLREAETTKYENAADFSQASAAASSTLYEEIPSQTSAGGGVTSSDLSRPVRGGTFPPQNHRIPPKVSSVLKNFRALAMVSPPTIPISPPNLRGVDKTLAVDRLRQPFCTSIEG
jgi:hypothetical protein